MEDSIGKILFEVSRQMRRFFDERARTIGITRAQWQVLTLLTRHEGCNQGTLAELLEVEPITLCRMVDRLQEAELVERRRDPSDRRAWRLYLTQKAQALLEELRPITEEVVSTSLDGLSEDEQKQLKEMLSRIRQNLTRRSNLTDGDNTNSDPGAQ